MQSRKTNADELVGAIWMVLNVNVWSTVRATAKKKEKPEFFKIALETVFFCLAHLRYEYDRHRLMLVDPSGGARSEYNFAMHGSVQDLLLQIPG